MTFAIHDDLNYEGRKFLNELGGLERKPVN